MSDKYSAYLKHRDSDDTVPHADHTHSNIDDNHAHDHQHHSTHTHTEHIRQTNAKVLIICLMITFIFSLGEALGGYFTHSITLQSDALHMLTDAAGLLIAYIANIISQRPATINLTFGYGKAEALGALINCVFTLVLTLGLFVEVIERFLYPSSVSGMGLLVIAGIGFVTNGSIAFILSKNSHSLNIKAAFIHAMGDLLASFIAIVAGLLIIYTSNNLIDPALSLIVVAILIWSNFKLIKKSSVILMAGVPEHLNYEQIGTDLQNIVGVVGVHDLHVWYLTANITALSAHVTADDPLTWQKTLLLCQDMLKSKHKIEHVTIQYEFNTEILSCVVQKH